MKDERPSEFLSTLAIQHPTHNQTSLTMVTGIEAAGARKLGFQLINSAVQNSDTLKGFNLAAVYDRI
jgi:hypothetical protein